MIMMMKKQQWMMFKQVFSMINSSSSSGSSISIFNNNNVLRLRRPFCSTTTVPVSNNNKKHELNMLLEKKHPLLLVPYDHITPKEYVLCPPKIIGDTIEHHYYVCDGTFGFVNVFHDDDELIINKKKKKEVEVYDVYLPEIDKRKICGSSEGWLVTAYKDGEFQLLNPVTRDIVDLPSFTTLCTYSPVHYTYNLQKVVTNTTTTTTNSTTLPAAAAAAANTVVVITLYDAGYLSFCRTLSSTGTDDDHETTTTTTAWIEIPVKVPMSYGVFFCYTNNELKQLYDEFVSYEVIDGVDHWVTKWSWWVDVAFYKGNFYTVGPDGMVGVVKGLDGPSPFVQFLIYNPEINIQSSNCLSRGFLGYHDSQICYLVDSSAGGNGDLLMVMRNVEDVRRRSETETETEEDEEEENFKRPYKTNRFKVWKLDLNGPSWEEVTDVGEDCALFVGLNHSFSFSASKIPGCRGNCIYFTDNGREVLVGEPNAGHDIGLYNLEDDSFETLNYETCSDQLLMPSPIWYVRTT